MQLTPNLIFLLVNSLFIVSVGILITGLVPVWKLMTQLPSGKVHRKWHIRWYLLLALTMVIFAAYLSYALAAWYHTITLYNLIVPGVFFVVVCFLWFAFTVTLQTDIENRRINLLERATFIDPLTGFYNRRYLDRRLEEEFARTERYKSPLSLLLVDIDHFKNINDTYGHQAGDLALKLFSRLTLTALRKTDIPTRYGGDEFLVIAPNTPATSAGALAERIRHQVGSQKLVLTDKSGKLHGILITLSIGVASFGPGTDNIEKLVKEVDEALYRAKQIGRSRVNVNHVGILGTTNP